MKIKTLILSMLLALNLSAITIGESPSHVTIDGENGGLVKDSSIWDSNTLKDKVLVLFYVDPDEKDTNNNFSAALKAKKYDRTNYGSIAIINMAATWKPNFAIESALESKQEEFPDTLYVKDKKSVLVNAWGIDDDASNVLIFSKDSKLLFYQSGALNDSDIQKALEIIETNL
ncbi:MAG: YtfJ family protein [Campylobacterota bacterium]|nr:YtfJ family protein [Campylobacterota bacterium]